MEIKYNDLIKVLIADDHKLFRAGIIRMLSDYPDISVIDEAENGELLLSKYFEKKPDVALVDISMPKLSGIEALKKIKAKDNDAKVLFLSMYDSEDFVYSCLASGGMGLVNKNIMEGELVYAIRRVHGGEKYFGKYFNKEKIESLIMKYESVYSAVSNLFGLDLTNREIDILRLIGKGYTSALIAEELSISVRTIDTHRAHLLRKLKLNTASELIKYAIHFNLKEEN